MLSVSVKTDIDQLKVKLFELRSLVISKATVSALNKTSLACRTQAVKAMRKKLKRMKAAAIKKRISLIKATTAKQMATIRNKRATIPPGAFKLPGSGDELFIHVGPKHKMIVAKTGKSAGKQISSGYQIAPLNSLQVNAEFESSAVQQVMQVVARDKFPVIFERDLKHYGRR